MDILLIEYLKDFLSKNEIDGLIINSTNEFLVEYNVLSQNSRYYVTGFTGSTGDVLFTNNKIYQFVDPRYHEQADIEVNHDYTEVIKIPLGISYLTALTEIIPSYFKLGVISKKTSKDFYDGLLKNLQQKNSTIKLLSTEPVYEFKKPLMKDIKYNVFNVSTKITELSADEKFEKLKECIGNKFNVLVTSLEDIAYLTNMRSFDFDYSSVFPAKAIITENEAKIYSDCQIPYIGTFFRQYPTENFENDLKLIKNEEIFIDTRHLTIYDYLLINQTNKIEKSHLSLMKTVKNEKEINHLKDCFARADEALKIVYEMINSDTIYTEYDYYEALIKSMKEHGALSLSFKPIVAAGKNTSIIHYTSPSKEKNVEDGDFLLIDYGGYYNGGYATDTTRTFIKGAPTPEQKAAYTSVLKAFLNAYYTKYDKKASYYNIDKIARDTLEKSINPEYKFSHGTGHGVGISVHENPPIVSSSNAAKTKILENTVFSIEPGAYKENTEGIRLENTVYATYEDDKIIMNTLSHFPFEIKSVDLSMLNDYEKYYYMKWQAESCIQ